METSSKGPKRYREQKKHQDKDGNGNETRIKTQCMEMEACLKNNNSNKAQWLVKDLSTDNPPYSVCENTVKITLP